MPDAGKPEKIVTKEEALARIAEERRARTGKLDLGADWDTPSGFDDLSPLADMGCLTELSLKHWRGLTDLTPLSGLSQLQSLDLKDCGSVSDLTPLRGLSRLQSLNLVGCQSVSDLTPLSELIPSL